MKKRTFVFLIALLAFLITTFISDNTTFITSLNQKAYDELVRLRYRFTQPPKEIKDIVLVAIDNDTLNNIKDRWPYPRTVFAKVVDNLKKAGARVIAFDFVFYGVSDEHDDTILGTAFKEAGNVVLGATIDDSGRYRASTVPIIADNTMSGIVTKIQDQDGKVRKSLTYLIDVRNPTRIAPSWGFEILKLAKDIDMTSLKDGRNYINLTNKNSEEWSIPIDPATNSFRINFRAHSTDLKYLSFYKVEDGDFDASAIKDKIVLVGFLSNVLGDIHDTPLGWMPGITLNANELLTLYAKDFLHKISKSITVLLVFFGSIISSASVIYLKKLKAYIVIAAEITLFAVVSYFLLVKGFVWGYASFPVSIFISVLIAKRYGLER